MFDISITMHFLPSLLTLFFLELVLGIDNLVFVSLAASALPPRQQPAARNFGLILALCSRLLLLASVNWIASFIQPLFSIGELAISGRDLILGFGGLFLMAKGTLEIHEEFDRIDAAMKGIQHKKDASHHHKVAKKFMSVIIQIGLLDIIFSIDSVITAVGMTQHYWVMATAIILAVIFMLYANHPLSKFIMENPSIKMLAISFIIMVGMILVANSLHFDVPKGYLYFSIGFSLSVEILNMLLRKKKT